MKDRPDGVWALYYEVARMIERGAYPRDLMERLAERLEVSSKDHLAIVARTWRALAEYEDPPEPEPAEPTPEEPNQEEVVWKPDEAESPLTEPDENDDLPEPEDNT
jgi:hypothetical protein